MRHDEPLRAVLVGAGLVGQVAHLTTLTDPASAIRLGGVVDASPQRAREIGTAHGVPFATELADIDLDGIDAAVIATPDPSHFPLISEALDRRLHVFCEKPLGISFDEARMLARKAIDQDRVCQVGYMKRFDPAVATLLEHMRAHGSTITSLAVEVRDPDASPFVREYPFVRAGDDMDANVGEDGSRRFHAHVSSIVGTESSREQDTAYGSFISALIHDLNLVRLLLRVEVVVEAGYWSLGGLQVGMNVRTSDGVLARLTHTQTPEVADYQERFIVYTDQGIYEMTFPAPYLLNEPTRLVYIVPKDSDEVSGTEDLNASTEEAFYLELQSFAAAAASGSREPTENSFADAAIDLGLLEEALRLATRS
jgi:predicted dehydrogenase